MVAATAVTASRPRNSGGNHGTVEIDTPRDRNGTYDPLLVKKNQTRLTQMDDQILALYAKGMSTREIVDTFKEMYGADVSPTLVSRVTEQVMETLVEWQHRPLSSLYPILYLDCLVLKIRNDGRVVNKSVYLALGVNLDGHKELLGLWLAENEGSKFWLSILTELKTRGVEDILIACVDGLKGFPEAINAEYPDTQVQLCIVHMVRNSLRYVSYKDYKNVTADLKTIYQAVSETEAAHALEQFAEAWDAQYPVISKIWRRHWDHVTVLFQYPPEIRKAIYTTNAIESLNSVIRKATKNHKAFTTQLTVLLMLAGLIAKLKPTPGFDERDLVHALHTLPQLIERTLAIESEVENLATRFADKHHTLFLGRSTMNPIAMEGALKLKELSYIHAEAYPAGELKHGPLALVDEDMPVVAVAPNDQLVEKLRSNLSEVKARGGELIVFTDFAVVDDSADEITQCVMPATHPLIAPIVFTVPLQMLAYHVAVLRGTDVDQPRNLAKSVTVE